MKILNTNYFGPWMKQLSVYLCTQKQYQDLLITEKSRECELVDVFESKSNPSPITLRENARIMIRAWSWHPPLQEKPYATL